jgi:hypothetical protein
MTLEELLKAKGYSTQEMEDLKPLLANSKFRSDLEAELSNGAKAVKDLDEYDRWFTNEITPQHQELLNRVALAEADVAASKARFEAYQKAGMQKQAGKDAAAVAAAAEEEAEKARKAAAAAGIDTSKFVTSDTLTKISDSTGDAMANAIDITTEHMQLFPGQRLNMQKLRNEAKAARIPVRDFWENKYKVKEREQEILAKAEADKIAEAEKRGYQKATVEFGGSNPNLRIPGPSTSPFVVKKVKEGDKQPWERNASDLSKARIEKAISKAAERGEYTPA